MPVSLFYLPREVCIQNLGVTEEDFDVLEKVDRIVNQKSQLASNRIAKYVIRILAQAKERPYIRELYNEVKKQTGINLSFNTFYGALGYLKDGGIIYSEDMKPPPKLGKVKLITRVGLTNDYDRTLRKYSEWL